MEEIKEVIIKCPNCHKSIYVYPTKIKNQYVCLKCVCVFEPKKQLKVLDLVKWEELANLKGKKIMNVSTAEIVTVNWDSGYPEYIDSHDERKSFVCADFAHDGKLWGKI